MLSYLLYISVVKRIENQRLRKKYMNEEKYCLIYKLKYKETTLEKNIFARNTQLQHGYTVYSNQLRQL